MPRLLSLTLLALLTASSVRAWEVSGEITGYEGLVPVLVFAIPTSFDTVNTTIVTILNNEYSFELEEGNYYFAAYQDVNLSLSPDLGDPFGFWGDGQLPQALQVDQDYDNIDIELSTTNAAGFSGTISYEGEATGPTFIVAYDSPDFTGIPGGAGIMLDLTGGNDDGNGPYSALCDSAGTFYAFAYMDLNGNIQYDPEEPMGIYGGETPEPIEVVIGDLPTDIDIELHDAQSSIDRPRIGGLPEGYSLGAPYPNPFNAETSIPITLPESSQVSLVVYDLLGREIGQILNERLAPGKHEIPYSAAGLSTGVYFLEMTADGYRSQQRFILIK